MNPEVRGSVGLGEARWKADSCASSRTLLDRRVTPPWKSHGGLTGRAQDCPGHDSVPPVDPLAGRWMLNPETPRAFRLAPCRSSRDKGDARGVLILPRNVSRVPCSSSPTLAHSRGYTLNGASRSSRTPVGNASRPSLHQPTSNSGMFVDTGLYHRQPVGFGPAPGPRRVFPHLTFRSCR